jgi:predicted AAA+ superfamily ATPase
MKNNLYLESLNSLKNKKVFLRKKYIEKIKNFSDTGNILVLEGQRRVGKSYSII